MSAAEVPLLCFSDDELFALLEPPGPAIEATGLEGPVQPSEELQSVARRIAGQYAELIEVFAAGVFTRRPSPGAAARLAAGLDALHRLLFAAAAADAAAAVSELQRDLEAFLARQARGRGADRMATRLRAWIPRFAAFLDPAAAARLLDLVSFRRQAIPLFTELGAIPGIGPRRLERLYCAGLYSVDAVYHADPEEVAQVTGLPPELARRVVEATRRFADEEQLRSARELSQRAAQIQRGIASGRLDPEVLSLAREALAALQAALDGLPNEENP